MTLSHVWLMAQTSGAAGRPFSFSPGLVNCNGLQWHGFTESWQISGFDMGERRQGWRLRKILCQGMEAFADNPDQLGRYDGPIRGKAWTIVLPKPWTSCQCLQNVPVTFCMYACELSRDSCAAIPDQESGPYLFDEEAGPRVAWYHLHHCQQPAPIVYWPNGRLCEGTSTRPWPLLKAGMEAAA